MSGVPRTEALPDVLNVRVSRGLAETWLTRDSGGRLLTVEWGEPDDEGFYTPVITAHDDDRLGELDRAWREAEDALPEGSWIRFAGPFTAVVDDKRFVVEARQPDANYEAKSFASGHGPTPTEALQALATRLRA